MFVPVSNCLVAGALFALLTLAPSVGAQVRFADRLPGGSHSAVAAEKQTLVAAISRGELKQIAKAKSDGPRPLCRTWLTAEGRQLKLEQAISRYGPSLDRTYSCVTKSQ